MHPVTLPTYSSVGVSCSGDGNSLSHLLLAIHVQGLEKRKLQTAIPVALQAGARCLLGKWCLLIYDTLAFLSARHLQMMISVQCRPACQLIPGTALCPASLCCFQAHHGTRPAPTTIPAQSSALDADATKRACVARPCRISIAFSDGVCLFSSPHSRMTPGTNGSAAPTMALHHMGATAQSLAAPACLRRGSANLRNDRRSASAFPEG